jgi:hypothetical protein
MFVVLYFQMTSFFKWQQTIGNKQQAMGKGFAYCLLLSRFLFQLSYFSIEPDKIDDEARKDSQYNGNYHIYPPVAAHRISQTRFFSVILGK